MYIIRVLMGKNRNKFFKTCVHKEGDKEPIKLPINMVNIDILSISLDGGKLYQKSSFFLWQNPIMTYSVECEDKMTVIKDEGTMQ